MSRLPEPRAFERAGPAPVSPRPGRSSPNRTPRAPVVPRPTKPPASAMQVLRGIAVSPGVAIGPAWVLDPRGLRLPPRAIAPEAVEAELSRLESALALAKEEVEAAEADARRRLGPDYAAILAAHSRMIDDPMLRREARGRIERDTIAAEHAVLEVLDGLAARLEGLADSHLAARAADVRDVELRILDGLAGGKAAPAPLDGLVGPNVLLAHDLTPSQTAGLDPRRVLGFATEAGGRASHTAIVAAGLEIPAVVGLGPFLPAARRCRRVIIDGDEGQVVLDPDAATLRRYREATVERAARFASLARLADLPATTVDGVKVELQGNIEFPGEVEACRRLGACGVGLYRTEFLYLNAVEPPSEEDQLAAYAAVVRTLGDRPVTIRTLDLGADKLPAGPRALGLEPNPFLGLRSLRLSLRDPSLFRTQLRAILRAATLGDVRIMFPLVSTLGEFRRARDLVSQVAGELAAEGIPARPDLPIGAMIEVPAAAMMADKLAKEVDFFSLGTNDLVQYTLAVDRTNETVADLYSAADPSILRLIRMVVEAARPRSIPVNVCGAMGGEPLFAPLLVGLGLRQLSMPPHQIPEVKRVVRALDLAGAEALTAAVLDLDTADEVQATLRDALQRTLAACPPVAEPEAGSEPESRAASRAGAARPRSRGRGRRDRPSA